MTTALEAILGKVEEALRYNTAMIRDVYKSIQQREAEKVPGDWRPYRAVVWSTITTQIIQGNFRRQSIAIKNDGPSVVLLSNQNFDGNEALADYNAANLGSVGQYYPIAVGESVTFYTTGAIYAFSVSESQSSNQYGILRCVESMFLIGNMDRFGNAHKNGAIGSIEKGITNPFTEHQLTGLK